MLHDYFRIKVVPPASNMLSMVKYHNELIFTLLEQIIVVYLCTKRLMVMIMPEMRDIFRLSDNLIVNTGVTREGI